MSINTQIRTHACVDFEGEMGHCVEGRCCENSDGGEGGERCAVSAEYYAAAESCVVVGVWWKGMVGSVWVGEVGREEVSEELGGVEES